MGGKRAPDAMPPLQVPGNTPYKAWKTPPENAPVTDQVLCTLCGLCAAACPTAAIAVEETVTTDESACILCSACVKACPTGAREWEWPQIAKWRKWLSIEHGKRKEPEVFL
jgi:ferredoxin